MNVNDLKEGEFYRYPYGNNILTLRKESDCFILIEPQSFTLCKFNNIQSRLLQLLVEQTPIDVICEDMGLENTNEVKEKIESFKHKCEKSNVLEI